MKRRVTVEIDHAALVRNYRRIAAKVRPAKVLCVLKANAYGLGVSAYAKTLAEAGCEDFGVAEPFEAMELLRVLKKRFLKELLVSVIKSHCFPTLIKRFGIYKFSTHHTIIRKNRSLPIKFFPFFSRKMKLCSF